MLPPIMDGPSVQPVCHVPAAVKAIAGVPNEISLAATPVSEASLSVTEPGEAPAPGSSLQRMHWPLVDGLLLRGVKMVLINRLGPPRPLFKK